MSAIRDGRDDGHSDETLKALIDDLELAMQAFHATLAAKNEADRQHTESTNRVNLAQRALDHAMMEIKSRAPWNTDWASSQRREYTA